MNGLLGSLVSQVAQGAMGGGNGGNGGIGDMIGNAVGGAIGGNTNAGGVGAMLSGALGGGDSSKGMLLATLMPMVLNWVQGNGGLSGALEKAKSLGLEQHVLSWMSSDENMNLDASQVTGLFGAEKITEVATKVGSDENAVTAGISQLLPDIMNKLTPQGGLENEEEANLEIGNILGQLGKFL